MRLCPHRNRLCDCIRCSELMATSLLSFVCLAIILAGYAYIGRAIEAPLLAPLLAFGPTIDGTSICMIIPASCSTCRNSCSPELLWAANGCIFTLQGSRNTFLTWFLFMSLAWFLSLLPSRSKDTKPSPSQVETSRTSVMRLSSIATSTRRGWKQPSTSTGKMATSMKKTSCTGDASKETNPSTHSNRSAEFSQKRRRTPRYSSRSPSPSTSLHCLLPRLSRPEGFCYGNRAYPLPRSEPGGAHQVGEGGGQEVLPGNTDVSCQIPPRSHRVGS